MRPMSDMTARARIRDAAMRRFAEFGVKETTIRGVAEEAGVTAGLVSHHFGTKQGLREACDEYVLEFMRQVIKEGVDEKGVADPAYLGAVFQSGVVVLRYVARALVDGSAAAESLFDNLVALTEQYLMSHPPRDTARPQDLRAHAAVLVAMRLGVWMLHPHLMRVLGVERLGPELFSRLSAAILDIISPDFAGTDLVALARTGIERYQQTTKERE